VKRHRAAALGVLRAFGALRLPRWLRHGVQLPNPCPRHRSRKSSVRPRMKKTAGRASRLVPAAFARGQGRGRTADLPLFSSLTASGVTLACVGHAAFESVFVRLAAIGVAVRFAAALVAEPGQERATDPIASHSARWWSVSRPPEAPAGSLDADRRRANHELSGRRPGASDAPVRHVPRLVGVWSRVDLVFGPRPLRCGPRRRSRRFDGVRKVLTRSEPRRHLRRDRRALTDRSRPDEISPGLAI
jgi:hypothetical protein